MKVWITKYALSRGIFEMDVRSQSEDGKAVYGKAWDQCFHGQGIEWCKTKTEAIAIAEGMRQKKIDSMKKQIEKLEKMKFE